MKISLSTVIKDSNKLVAFPSVANELFAIIDDDTSDAQIIAQVIQRDPSLTASLLKLANSAWYMARHKVSCIEEAVVRIGMSDISKIALNICVCDSLRDVPENLLTLEDYFDHSLRCAFAAQEIARWSNIGKAGSIYTAGLLHDVGKIILLNLYPQESSQAIMMDLDEYNGIELQRCERKIFGFDHAQVGEQLAKEWGFPSVLQHCIRYHHAPSETGEYKKEVYCTHLANTIAMLNELDSDDLSEAPRVEQEVWVQINQEPANVAKLIELTEAAYSSNKKMMEN